MTNRLPGARPGPVGLYHPDQEHDACGVSFVCDLHGRPSHDLVQKGLTSLCNLDHRGATGAEENTGDGAGILVQVPDAFLRAVLPFELPEQGRYAVGIGFLPADEAEADAAAAGIEKICAEEGAEVLGWRVVPVDPSMIGATALGAMPSFRQLFVADADGIRSGIELDRLAYVVRKRIEHEILSPDGEAAVYFPSLSCRTLVYKGMLTTPQLGEFFEDLRDERFESALALVHSRFSTNTFPSWPLAHPYRYVAHNGEINTVQGNQNWMRAREALLRSEAFPTGAGTAGLERIFPICTPGSSDTARLDEVLELLHLGGYSLPHAMLMMIPEAWEKHTDMDPAVRDFYRFHACIMEPWDGPASVTFTDGTVVGAVLDRNGLRPSRYWVCDDGLVVMASEVGTLPIDQERVVTKGRLQPGRMFLIDTEQGRIIDDAEIKQGLAAAHPYGEWLESNLLRLEDLPEVAHIRESSREVLREQQTFGYTHEDLRILIEPMARTGVEALGSMGTDTPLAVLSDRPKLVYDYFKQLFAQVTNPPLDAIREELVTSLSKVVGPEGNLLDPGPQSCHLLELPHPILNNEDLDRIQHVEEADPRFKSRTVRCLYPAFSGGRGLARALERIRAEVSEAIEDGANIIVLSDWLSNEDLAPIPMLLATAAVHHHLIREKTRTQVGLIVETGEAREVHHFALLLGYGAAAVNPYLAFDSIEHMINERATTVTDFDAAVANYRKAVGKGILKVMSKMGISTVASYTGAQIFEAIGLGSELVDEYFTGTVSRLGGIGLDEVAEEVRRRHARAYPFRQEERAHRTLEAGGEYQWRREGEYHLFNPKTVFKLQHATRSGQYEIFKEYTKLVDDQAEHLATLRGLFRLRAGDRPAVPLDEVEPASEIVKRFSTGAMSYGSISAEAHETLAIAMNRLGGKSNTGEGGEDPRRFTPDENGDLRRSSIKQVASGRFGVTAEYLTNSDDIQIKMAQGAKPGEGGQLPGHKVYPWIADTRHSTPGVGLISPPPHHDIYSIEDLAQLIHDLKNSNPAARIHVKLVAEVGVGTVAAGVAKAKSDVVLISGHDGGTGASPLTSLKHAGAPWELGLAETQQTLVLNGLRDRIVVQVDGQLKTGRDVVIGALLGAEEFGFATAPLVVSGCVMMRVCHLDTCPVGIATQNPVLRERFSGQPEFVENFMRFIAEEVRELLAELGFRSIEEAVGHAELIDASAAIDHWKAQGLDLSPILHVVEPWESDDLHHRRAQDHGLDKALDNTLITESADALDEGTPVHLRIPIQNVNRTVGTMLGHELTKRHGGAGLPDDTIVIDFDGSAGNSFGAFVPRGVTMRLWGDANDYVGKGLSGGRIVVRPPVDAHPDFVAERSIIAGNVILYGATKGEVYLRGIVGERFCVRNSGAVAVVEGVGDHGCEYMTGGRVVVLGPTGRNFGAGMSGGIAYVHDPDGTFPERVNYEMVALAEMDQADLDDLERMVRRHAEETGSPVAAALLDDWGAAVGRFRKVMPNDYQRVLDATARAEAEGLDVVETIMAASQPA
ncbi:glutamate synthase large subunit [Dermatobacter hominis]|uniref:glutamate synthase large subunit n=1 Tax=Dermatobacter hominis TaxID=2884263 RepID=UPI001D11AC6A|nr:glutamate synthase large subunit [Dermatobacter hominis]UDY36483.1 glutamate synthase large subunit [Dermatobacter hominis]